MMEKNSSKFHSSNSSNTSQNFPAFEKYKSKCAYDVMSFFHSHRHHSKKLTYEPAAGCDENSYGCEMHPLICEKKESVDLVQQQVDHGRVTGDSSGPKVRKVIEKDTSVEQRGKKTTRRVAARQAKSNSELVAEPIKHKQTSKSSWRPYRLPIYGCNDVSTVQQREMVPACRNIVDGSSKKTGTAKKHSNHARHGNGRSNRDDEMRDRLQTDKATEAVVNQKLIEGEQLGKDKINDQAKHYLDALEMLNSNKELFVKLLQDPDSILVKHIEHLRDTQTKKQQTVALDAEHLTDTERQNRTRRESEQPLCSESLDSDGCNPLKETPNLQCLEKIVPSTPEQADVQNAVGTSHDHLPVRRISKNAGHNIKPSYFPFKQMKEKLMHVIGVDNKHKEVIPITKIAVCKHIDDFERKKGIEGNQEQANCSESTAKEALAASSILNGLSESYLSEVYQHNGHKCHGNRISLPVLLRNKSVDLFRKQRPKSWDGISYDSFATSCPTRKTDPTIPQMSFFPHSNSEMTDGQMHNSAATICHNSPNCNADLPSASEEKNCNHQLRTLEFVTSSSAKLFHIIASEDNSLNGSEDLSASSTDLVEITELENNESAEDSHHGISTGSNDSSENEVSSSAKSDSSQSHACIQRTKDFGRRKEGSEQQSPVSVLEDLFVEDLPSPIRMQSYPEEILIQPSGICTKDLAASGKSITDQKLPDACVEDQESISDNVNAILKANDLDWDELLFKWHSSEQLHDQSLFENSCLWSNKYSIERRLVFDYIDEVLADVTECYYRSRPWLSFVKSKGKKFLMAENAVNETMKHIDWKLMTQALSSKLLQVFEKDLTQSGTWMDIRIDADDVVSEIAEEILQDVVTEMVIE